MRRPNPTCRRDELRARADCQFVGPEQFCQLLVSSLPLARSDDALAGVRGLYDRQTETRFLIEEERLFCEGVA